MAVPMIGVLVLLLVATMVLTPPIHGPRLPVAATATPVPRNGLTVGVDGHGHVWIAGVADPGPVAAGELAGRLRELRSGRGEPSVLYLQADESLSYARMQPLLRAASKAGVRNVQLIAECPRGTESLLRTCRT
jgi:biopolymer transport protein ExbD